MSIAIDIDKVTGVLLADGWHKVEKKSFYLDAYEFVSKPRHPETNPFSETEMGGGEVKGVSATGAAWLEKDKKWVAAPMNFIYGVRFDD